MKISRLGRGRAIAPLIAAASFIASAAFSPADEIRSVEGVLIHSSTTPTNTGLDPEPRSPEPAFRPASTEAEKLRKGIVVPSNFKVDLFAAEPMLANPVAIDIDNQGRVFVAETNRIRTSALDVRHYMFLEEDDMACRTCEDRLAEIKKNFPNEWPQLGIETEVVRLLEDRHHSGKADFSSAYAAGMNSVLDGTCAGVLARDGKVWCANIPNLWLFDGLTPDGKATKREALSTGYGVRFSLTGHDLHGLVLGPDHRLYFSFGDRGAHVKTKEGTILDYPDEGAVFRCELDGSHLEAVAHGLRNPQDLAFDDCGNLFTGDNDADLGDHERWVLIVDGGDSGWRVGYQHSLIGKHNPWMAENLWIPHFEGQAAYIVPPLANILDGPSGLCYYPGVGMPPKYEGHFFLCGFSGSSARSSVATWSNQPKGASFELVNSETFIRGAQPTAVCFGPDRKLYFTEWGEGWQTTGRGRIYTVYDPVTIQDPQVAEVQKLLGEGFKQRAAAELAPLLAHKDQRVRLEAQWALAEKPDGLVAFLNAATHSPDRLARIHGIWGVAQVARAAEYQHTEKGAAILDLLPSLLADQDDEIRAQTAKVLGDTLGNSSAVREAGKAWAPKLVPLLGDPSLRVRFFAAVALGQLGVKEAAPDVIAMLRANADQDQYLRHAGVMALLGANDFSAIQKAAQDESPSVRMAALLVMRRLKSPEIAAFLHDRDPLLVAEAARAINDESIVPAYESLARLIDKPSADEAFMFRVINANLRAGTPDAAQRLAAFAADASASATLRLEALTQLSSWPKPFPRDRVTALYSPLPPREAQPAITALKRVLPKLLASDSSDLVISTIDALAALGIKDEGAALLALMSKPALSAAARAEALQMLAGSDDPRLAEAIKLAIHDEAPSLRVQASAMLGKIDPGEAARQLSAEYPNAAIKEKKAILNALGEIRSPAASQTLSGLLDDFHAGKVPGEVQLELLEAAAQRSDCQVKLRFHDYETSLPPGDLLAAFRPALLGGNKDAGERLFKEYPAAACLRCHKVHGSGGDAAPDLTKIGATKDRTYILESILLPNAKIAESFQIMMMTLKSGDVQVGLIKSETADELVLQMPGGQPVTVKRADIVQREMAPSSMPPNFAQVLTKREIRDLVEYVASLK